MQTPQRPRPLAATILTLAMLAATGILALSACGDESTTAESSLTSSADRSVTPSSTASLPTPTTPGTLAYVSSTKASGEGAWDVSTICTDGTGLAGLAATGPDNEGFPAWSPDGRQIAYVFAPLPDDPQAEAAPLSCGS